MRGNFDATWNPGFPLTPYVVYHLSPRLATSCTSRMTGDIPRRISVPPYLGSVGILGFATDSNSDPPNVYI